MNKDVILQGLVHLWSISGPEYRRKLEQSVKVNHPNIAADFLKAIAKKG